MHKTMQVILLAIIAAVAVIGGMLAINPSGASYVQANQGPRTGLQRWDYCAITDASGSGGSFGYRGVASIRYFQTGGWRDESVEFVPDFGERGDFRNYENGALAKAIAKLGNEGWELVLKEPSPENKNRYIFYFKRPKQ
jgi:hypothetical protein